MADERALRAAEKIHRSRSEEKRIEVMTTLEQQRWHTAKIIAAEYADVLAENERLKAGWEADAALCKDYHLTAMRLEQQVEAMRAAARAVVEDCRRFGEHRGCAHRVVINKLDAAIDAAKEVYG